MLNYYFETVLLKYVKLKYVQLVDNKMLEDLTKLIEDPSYRIIVLLSILVTTVITIIGATAKVIEWVKWKLYKPKIGQPWTEGTVLIWRAPAGEIVGKDPAVYIYSYIDPGKEMIHDLEIEIRKDGMFWYAFLDGSSWFRGHIHRRENFHIARIIIDTKSNRIKCEIPRYEPFQRPYGGWMGRKIEKEQIEGKLNLIIRGHIRGRKVEKKAKIKMELIGLLKNIKWQEEWIKTEPDLIEKAKRVITNLIRELSGSKCNCKSV